MIFSWQAWVSAESLWHVWSQWSAPVSSDSPLFSVCPQNHSLGPRSILLSLDRMYETEAYDVAWVPMSVSWSLSMHKYETRHSVVVKQLCFFWVCQSVISVVMIISMIGLSNDIVSTPPISSKFDGKSENARQEYISSPSTYLLTNYLSNATAVVEETSHDDKNLERCPLNEKRRREGRERLRFSDIFKK